jgi:hypothetical protein
MCHTGRLIHFSDYDPAFAPVLETFRLRFRATNTEEGVVMETVGDGPGRGQQPPHASEQRKSEKVRRLVEPRVLELDALRSARTRLRSNRAIKSC